MPTNTIPYTSQTYSFLFILSISFVLHLFCIDAGSLLVEEAYYWNYAQHLDFSYLDHPPMVAILIRTFTSLLGHHEYSVRSASLFCWLGTAFFSYRLTALMQEQAAKYTILLLATLPFFFFQSIIITPDVPLLTCWSAALYYLYRCLVLNETNAWYWAGVWLGLGMLSKYTICLVGLATIMYMLYVPPARQWFFRKEPYLSAVISLLFFTPVLYWNATHQWVSFIFQSSRRFSTTTPISIHHLIWITLFYITPLGILGLWQLSLRKQVVLSNKNSTTYLQLFIIIPLGFFALFSLNHEVNFNWIGPIFLALLPWLSLIINTMSNQKRQWIATMFILLLVYTSVLLAISYNKSEQIQQKLFIKIIDWEQLVKQFNALATRYEEKTHLPTLFVPLDKYPIASELAFYQTKLSKQGIINKAYEIIGADLFNRESLMYRYWSKKEHASGKMLILISKELWRFNDPEVANHITAQSAPTAIWSVGQGKNIKNIPYYYQIAQIK